MERNCASFQYSKWNFLTIVSVNCYERDDAHLLCEVPPDHVNNTASYVTVSENIHFPATPNFTRSDFPFKVTSCPDGHVTHEMFACDLSSACWVNAATTSRSCRSSLQPLPPSFTCTTGLDDVPYTLVCDHRPDCKDSSDESFCDYPPCNLLTHFDCGNREVRSSLFSLGFCQFACLPVYSLVFLGLCQSVRSSACMPIVRLRVQLSVRLLVCMSASPSMSVLACFPVYS